jgi:hypothetical protein
LGDRKGIRRQAVVGPPFLRKSAIRACRCPTRRERCVERPPLGAPRLPNG